MGAKGIISSSLFLMALLSEDEEGEGELLLLLLTPPYWRCGGKGASVAVLCLSATIVWQVGFVV